MEVTKISEKLTMAFGSLHANRKFFATNDGNLDHGYATGATVEEAVKNLKAENVRIGLVAISDFIKKDEIYPPYGDSEIQKLSSIVAR